MDANTYNCIIIDTYTDIYPILVAGRVLTLTHLAAKDNFEDARLVVVIIVTLCIIVHAITDTCTTCGDNTTTKIGCKPLRGRAAAGSVCTIINHIYLYRTPARLGRDGATLGAPASMLTAGRGGVGRRAARCDACAAPCMRHSANEMGWPG